LNTIETLKDEIRKLTEDNKKLVRKLENWAQTYCAKWWSKVGFGVGAAGLAVGVAGLELGLYAAGGLSGCLALAKGSSFIHKISVN
jgi:hypothetical protein